MAIHYLLTSRDYDGFEPPLAFEVIRGARVPEGYDPLLVRLNGAFDLSSYGLSDQERFLIIAARHEGTKIRDAQDGETVSVFIYHARKAILGGRAARANKKDLIAWGEVYCENTA